MTHVQTEVAVRKQPGDHQRGVVARTGPGTPERQVVLMAVAMFVLAGALWPLIPDTDTALRPSGGWAWVLAAVAFGVSEYTVFNVHFRRQGIAFNLSEIPIALSLVLLAPLPAILVRLPIAVPVLVFVRKNQPYKLAFNIALAVFETTLGILLVRWLVELWGSSPTMLVLALAATLLIVTPSASVVISIAISRFEGELGRRIVDELRASWWMYTVNVVLAVMVIALVFIEPWLVVLAVLPAGGLWYVLRSYGDVAQELRDLDAVHGFAGRIGRTLDLDEICTTAVEDIVGSFRAAGAAIVRFDDAGAVVHATGRVDAHLPETVHDEVWRPVLAGEEARLLTRRELTELGLGRAVSASAILACPVVDDEGPFALLVAAQADTYGHRFDRGDVDRLGNMAGQLAVSLRRGMLHKRLEHEARHDALTDLPARTLFERAVADAIASDRPGFWAVMMLDLDRFKEVNDTLGHHAGDELLVEFSRRMLALLGPDDVLARLAGDEFAILCHRPTYDHVLDAAQAVVRSGGSPVTLDGLEIVVTVSVGVAELTDVDDDPLQPMRRADIAMYNAKWQRTGVELYRDEIDRRTPARLSMLGDLRAAIHDDQLDVVYQPKLDLRTGAITGAEALVRWEHVTRGVVAPTEFVRVAEDTGLIKDLTDLVLARGIRDLRRFERDGLGIGLAVNLSTHDLFDGRLPDRVRGYLDSNDVRPDSLTLEITESSLLVDAPRTRATIDELHAVGLRLAVDDFGTGYSSLSYLRRLPVQELKIDQSFVSRMLHDPQDEVIVRSTIDLGHNLGLTVVAEGAESRSLLDRLAEFGCDVAQGYAIAQPMSADGLVAWILASRADEPTTVSPS